MRGYLGEIYNKGGVQLQAARQKKHTLWDELEL